MLELDDQDSSDSSGSQVIAWTRRGVDDQAAPAGQRPDDGRGHDGQSRQPGHGPRACDDDAARRRRNTPVSPWLLALTFVVMAITA